MTDEQKNRIKHPSGIHQEIVDKVVARRERLYAYESLDLSKTALVVIDLDAVSGGRIPEDMELITPKINELATALRAKGGITAWVTTPIYKATENFRAVFGEDLTRMYEQETASGRATTIWPALDTKAEDIYAAKSGHSAFFPGKCDLHEQLQQHNIESLLICGTVTNICCEASARDAAELHYRVTMISDALSGHSHGLHEAALANFFRAYGDVRPSDEVLELIRSIS